MAMVANLYKTRFEGTGIDRRDRVWKILCRHFFDRLIGPQSNVLELGCGYGEFINNISAARKFALDLNPDAQYRLNQDIVFWNAPATDLAALCHETVDVVFTSNFLEHLRDKRECDEVLSQVHGILRPNGKIIAMGPNIRYAYREYWDFYDHYLPLSHLSLAEGLQGTGFTIERNIPRFLPYSMNSGLPVHEIFIRAYLATPLAWRLLGKQFLVIAQK